MSLLGGCNGGGAPGRWSWRLLAYVSDAVLIFYGWLCATAVVQLVAQGLKRYGVIPTSSPEQQASATEEEMETKRLAARHRLSSSTSSPSSSSPPSSHAVRFSPRAFISSVVRRVCSALGCFLFRVISWSVLSAVTLALHALRGGGPGGGARRLRAAARAAGRADVDAVVVVVGTDGIDETEGADRRGMDLPGDQDAMVSAVAAAARARGVPIVVVLNVGSPKRMPWLHEVDAVLVAYFGGQGASESLVDVVFARGGAAPSGKLPTSWVDRIDCHPAAGSRRDLATNAMAYTEGIWVGHWGLQRFQRPPLFCFGHGLSYTSFEITGMSCRSGASKGRSGPAHTSRTAPRRSPRRSPRRPAGGESDLDSQVSREESRKSQESTSPPCVTVTVQNTGRRAGAEVVQCYVDFSPVWESEGVDGNSFVHHGRSSDNEDDDDADGEGGGGGGGEGLPPILVLKGFVKVHLDAGEVREVEIPLHHMRVWASGGGWRRVAVDDVDVHVGTSLEDIRGVVRRGKALDLTWRTV